MKLRVSAASRLFLSLSVGEKVLGLVANGRIVVIARKVNSVLSGKNISNKHRDVLS